MRLRLRRGDMGVERSLVNRLSTVKGEIRSGDERAVGGWVLRERRVLRRTVRITGKGWIHWRQEQ